MKLILTIAILSLGLNCFAQTVKITNFNQVERRVAAGADTVYVINFWATWCAPCVKELPYFEQLATNYSDKPLKVLLLSLDIKSKLEKSVIPFVQKHQLKAEVLLNDSQDQKFIRQVSEKWSGALPATLIVSKGKGIREFYEQEFTFDTLNHTVVKLLEK